MQDILIVVDMQNDFIDGALGTPEAVAIVPAAAEKIRSFPGPVLFTRDTHTPDYLNTQEGRNLPVVHCVRGTPGWELRPELQALCRTEPIDKPTFGSAKLGELLLWSRPFCPRCRSRWTRPAARASRRRATATLWPR